MKEDLKSDTMQLPATLPALQSKDRRLPITFEINKAVNLIEEAPLSPVHLKMIMALVMNIQSQLSSSPKLQKKNAYITISRANVQYYLEQVEKAAELVASKLYVIIRDEERVWPRYLQFLLIQLSEAVAIYIKRIETFQLSGRISD